MFPPGLFSMMTGCPSASASLGPIWRARRSLEPPGESGTMKWIGLLGYGWAAQGSAPASSAAARSRLTPSLLLRIEYQLLHPPVEQLGDVEQVLGRAGDLVDPAELLELLARLAEHAEHLALERELVHPSGESVGCVEHLVRARRDAHRPRRARHHDLVGQGLDLRHVG